MNKAELISDVAKAAGLTKTDAERAIDATFETITTSMARGVEVRLIGFGTFAVAQRAATTGRNPRTGKPLEIPAKKMPKFRAGKQLREAVEK